MAVSGSGETFEADLELDEYGVLWLHELSLVTGRRVAFYGLATVLMLGWRLVRVSSAEQALLEAHGFGSERVH